MLAVRDLAVGRGGREILRDLSFDLAGGQALILRGRNGIGKTTLLRTLAGLTPPAAGTVEMAPGTAAYASHADGVKAALTVEENLRFWARLYRRPFEVETLARFDLADLRDRQAGWLSAGQTRRLGLARLDVIGRDLLLLDEPTVSLDAASVALFAGWLRERHLGRGGAAVIASHIDIGLDAPALELEGHVTPVEALAADGGFW